MPVTIIAEAGVNHNGDLETAKRMAYVAKECGADIVKYQTAVPELVVSRFAEKAEYQKQTTDAAESAACLDTINATMASPNTAATATVSTTISRLVREPASNQLNTSAPVPSVPSQWSRDGFAHTW